MLCDVERTEAYSSVELFISIYYYHSNQRPISLSNYIYRYLCMYSTSTLHIRCFLLKAVVGCMQVYFIDDCGVNKGEAEAGENHSK